MPGRSLSLEEVLDRRRGTAPGRQARDADELSVLVDRAGDVTREELEARVAPSTEWRLGNPMQELLASGRLIEIVIPGVASVIPSEVPVIPSEVPVIPSEVEESAPHAVRHILVDNYARYASAFGAFATETAVPEPLRHAALTQKAARREILGRWISLAGPVSVADAEARYGFDPGWIERRFVDWEQKNILVRGSFGSDRSVTRWCSRRVLEQARRRELAQARKQIEAVPLDVFERYLQRWQHLTPGTRLTGSDATARALAQMYGLARNAEGWEREYLPARVEQYDAGALSHLAASGALVWAAEPRRDAQSSAMPSIGRVRFFERGTGRLWLGAPTSEDALSENARKVLDALRAYGASFTSDLEAGSGLGPQATRDAIRELVADGLVTNDTMEALRDVLRWHSTIPQKRGNEPDPTRWLPADFKPSANRPVVQRRVNLRRLPRWRRPERSESAAGAWGGRWSLVNTPGTLGAVREAQELAEAIARKWLERYGVVSRDWWRREKPPVEWRLIYHELKRLEFRGEVQRGYFVNGLAGAQFALPEAVEMLRATGSDAEDATVVMATSDPANVYSLPLTEGVAVDPLARPRGTGAMLVTRGGRIVLSVESRGARIRVAERAAEDDVREAAMELGRHLVTRRRTSKKRDMVVDTIDGERAAGSRWTEAFLEAGYRSMGTGLRYLAGV